MAPSAALSTARHDDLMRTAAAAGHAFAPPEYGQDDGAVGTPRRLLTLSALSVSGFIASYGVFLILG
ncbi:hypothetical protein ASG40_17745 [Methylobacterium sp. Leaf399]|uniref:hypothetical protein n=1 Tax=Methylobacterium sp. Leaf399 TaxID=1736364 RepID=UPI000700ADE5|nr:hypothetical protein [Methylobacterium sp. Leaf399]KQT16539.1 hypothetical protein ASG40_17745 [Methylobacterium sp. Leaf399]